MSYGAVHNPALDSPGLEKTSDSSQSRLDLSASTGKRGVFAQPVHKRPRNIVRNLWLTTFLPILAFAYLGFCYAAATHVIPVRMYKIDNPAEHLYAIKAGVTTVNIVIVTLALLPLESVLCDLKSEEFFRRLRTLRSGAPLNEVNDVSIPSHSLLQGILSSFRGIASRYYTGALLAGFLGIAISSLAPAALSVGLVSIEGDLMAIEVGSVPMDSLYKPETLSTNAEIDYHLGQFGTEGAAMGWVQTVLGQNLSFLPSSLQYAVPVPLRVSPTTRARYLTDALVMDPVCKWTIPNPPAAAGLSSSGIVSQLNITIPEYNVFVNYTGLSSWNSNGKTIEVIGGDSVLAGINMLKNLTTKDPVTDGTMAFMAAVVTSQDSIFSSSLDPSKLDLSGLPTQDITFNDTTSISKNLTTAKFSILVCQPRARIETREVILNGSGIAHVTTRTGLGRQGNLHDVQTALLLSQSLSKYTSDSGPETSYRGIGKAGQVRMFFGSNMSNSTATPIIKPLPVEDITNTYARIQQAAMVSYLSGKFGTAHVPGRFQTVKLVFQSSIPQVIASTVLFGLVTLFIDLCFFRSYTEKFTLVAVSASLARSNISEVCEGAREDLGGGERALDQMGRNPVRLVDDGLGARHGGTLQMN
ncbi:hypothetical protein V5O48_007306 [Marasmius crinis-equi]|uniref:Uncharacterized protein n=1 Tax=Marasmius crinis-equi TaxID=585013 RepID=A0ABR3FHM5_9AGAR